MDCNSLLTTFDLLQFRDQCSSVWISNKQGAASHTIDFIVLGAHFAQAFVDAETSIHIDNGHIAQDHFPSIATLGFSSSSSKHGFQYYEECFTSAATEQLLC